MSLHARAGIVRSALACAAQAQQPKALTFARNCPGRTLAFRMHAETHCRYATPTAGSMPKPASSRSCAKARARARPVTFVIGGGPGNGVRLSQSRRARSVANSLCGVRGCGTLSPNAESWLDFTDLVFVDPPGTGLGRLVANDAKAKERVWSVDGDVDAACRRDRGMAAQTRSRGIAEGAGGAELWRPARAAHRREPASPSRTFVPVADPGLADPRLRLALSRALVAVVLRDAAAVLRGRAHGAGGQRSIRKALAAVEYYARGQFIEDYLRGLRDKDALKSLVDARHRDHRPAAGGRAIRARAHRRKDVRARIRAQARQGHLVLRSCGVRRRSGSGDSAARIMPIRFLRR